MKRSITDITNWSEQTALVREDLNAPLDATTGAITDDTRITAALPTLQYLLDQKAKVVVLSHLGRPKGKPDPAFSLKPVADRLAQLLPQANVQLAPAVTGPQVTAMVQALQPGQLLLLENTRFEPGEEANDPALAKALAALGTVFVHDAFGASHRAHASTEGLAHHIPQTVAGFLMLKEVDTLTRILTNPPRPLTAIIGGSKVSSKITVLQNLIPKVDNLIVGGGMRYTFFAAQGFGVGDSLVEPDFVPLATELMALAKQHNTQLWLPEDTLVANGFSNDAATQVVPSNAIPDGWQGLDIGPASIATLNGVLRNSKAVLWNGPMGVFEFANFAAGTKAMANTLAELTAEGVQTVLGGGDTVAAIEAFGIDPARYTHVSTGGGASLEFLEGKTLPGIAAIPDATAAATAG
jgi:phosphoglycerate kinase